MKRIVSCLLAFVLVFTPYFSASASEPEQSTKSAQGSSAAPEGQEKPGGEETGKGSTGEQADSAGAKGPAAEGKEEKAQAGEQTGGQEKDKSAEETAGQKNQTAGDISSQEEKKAAGESGGQEEKKTEEEAAGKEGQQTAAEAGGQEGKTIADSGQIDVSICQAAIFDKETVFTVSLTGYEDKEIVLAEDAKEPAARGMVSYENLPAGTYALTVSAPGFAGYTQEIKVDGWAYQVWLTTGFVSGFSYEEEQVHPGVLLVGDVDGNGVIDDADKTKLIDDIEAGKEQSPNSDLNGDGIVDIVDLEYFAKGYQISEDTNSSLEVSVPAAVIGMQPDNDTSVDGELDALLKDEGSVLLSRKDGQTISEMSPVSVTFDFPEEESYGADGIVIETAEDNGITAAELQIVYTEEGMEHSAVVPVRKGMNFLLDTSAVTVTQDAEGAICINLGPQIAVKKVSLKIMGMEKNNNLAEISRVKFVNGMENRISEPDMDIPENLSADCKNKSFTLTWDACRNVTGYEVLVAYEGEEEVRAVRGNSLTVTSFNQGKLQNNQSYEVKVQSVNGSWRSGYCEAVTAIPKTDKKPDAPDNLKVTGKFKAIGASWKNMEDTDSYNLYYRETGTENFQKIEGIAASNYTISELKNHTEYEVYVTGVNELGESGPSITGVAQTINPDPADMPKYKRINAAGEGEVSEHIISAAAAQGRMEESPKDTEAGTAWGTVDNNPVSYHYHGTWDSGGFNPLQENGGLVYEFDEAYEMEAFALQEASVQNTGYGYIQVRYWDENGTRKELGKVSIEAKSDSQGRTYYLIRLPRMIRAKKLQFGLARSLAVGSNTVSEVYFYHYDSLEDDIMALYADALHTKLKEEVNQETIDGLRTRLNTKDEVSGEYHPDKDALERELKTAEEILNAELTEPVQIYSSITTSDAGRGFGGLNAWQPLGISAAAGEEITIYVGHSSKRTGETTNLQLVATQYHAEAASMAQTISTPLKIGRNQITIPKLSSMKAEAGGALYIQYTGTAGAGNYAVRVNGGAEVPRLDLYRVTDPAERVRRAERYVEELDAYTNQMEERHRELHKQSENQLVQYDYDAKNCILGASDILLDSMLLSLPAWQIWTGAGTGTVEERAARLVQSMDAMEDMMYLFYQHKGLNNSAEAERDRLPYRHLNIRYQRMFAGAFMYASGNHIGIEWNETAGMIGCVPVQFDENGKYISGRYFGWGIAHEIGHCINQGAYAVAEITNNYFSVLAQAKDTSDSVRFQYSEVYKKVTSGTKGHASNVFTQLGMYWQLHLAYDNGYNYKTYANHKEQLDSLFFARVDSYARNPAAAPAPGGVSLSLSGNSDQVLMRLSCGAAKKNLLEFFERWGMTPDEATTAYASQFEPETRAIFYVNDDARVYRLEHEGSKLDTAGTVEAVGDTAAARINENAANQVDFVLNSKNIPEEDVLGYEIVRCTISGGETEEELAGFVTKKEAEAGTFSDLVTTMNNRVVTYKVRVIDQYLNRSAPKMLEPLKIEHAGCIDKTGWTADSAGITATSEGVADGKDTDTSCGPEEAKPLEKIIDGNNRTTYQGVAGDNAEVVLDFHKELTITGLQYTVTEGTPVKDYRIWFLNGKGGWTKAAEGAFRGDDTEIVYFAEEGGKNIASYQTTSVKLEIRGQKDTEISISELDVLGVTGDNVDFRRTGEGTAAIGRLSGDFVYGEDSDDVIPAGSIVFTGAYKGNPAYNVVMLYDQNGNQVGGRDSEGNLNAYQTILAEVPETGNVRDVSDGTWIYWIQPEDVVNLQAIEKVRAELYRVDNALTNEGQRMVSDSLFEVMPEELPEIQINSGGMTR